MNLPEESSYCFFKGETNLFITEKTESNKLNAVTYGSYSAENLEC